MYIIIIIIIIIFLSLKENFEMYFLKKPDK